MVSFESDYICGAHPYVLEKLAQTNMDAQSGYGFDKYTASAAEKIAAACELPDAQVTFLSGGTQTNAIAIDALLKSYEGVVAAATGHVNVHESGAIEHTGHKVLTLPSYEGKMKAEDLKQMLVTYYGDETAEHMVRPGMVYLTWPTELGTVYTKAELNAIADICHEYGMPLYIDGARLGYGLAGKGVDLTLPEIACIADVFYIGGTKVGALCGEALVFTKHNQPDHFMAFIKQRGALYAKGRLCGVQFDALFTGGLYFKIGQYAVDMAERLKDIFRKKGYAFHPETPTNQQFIVMPNEKIAPLREKVRFEIWEKLDEANTVVRFVTSWSTSQADLDYLESVL